MPTVRQHLEAARDYAKQAMEVERSSHPIGGVFDHIEAALKILDASSTAEGALQTDVYRIVADDPHRSPERTAR